MGEQDVADQQGAFSRLGPSGPFFVSRGALKRGFGYPLAANGTSSLRVSRRAVLTWGAAIARGRARAAAARAAPYPVLLPQGPASCFS